MHNQDNLLQFCCYQINLTQPIKVKSIQSIHHVIVKLCDPNLTSGVYQRGRQGPAEHQGAVGERVARAVRVEVGRGPLARV